MRKGEVTLKILDAVGDGLLGVADVFAAILSAGYGASYGKLAYEMDKLELERDRRRRAREADAQLRQRYYSLLHHLKQDGLIVERRRNGKRLLMRTPKGDRVRSTIRGALQTTMPLRDYVTTQTAALTLVAFDIPESERRKRRWLRGELRRLGLHMVQKSVWAGKARIPRELIEDLRDLKLVNYVEIFEITKSGSLRHIA
jgi:hypothetical protein